MPVLHTFRTTSRSFFFLVLAALAVGCTVETTPGESPTPSAPGACATTGTGSVAVNISGLPAETAAKVKITGAGGATDVDASRTLAGIAAGSYEVSADRVAVADPIVRTVYAPRVTESTFCLEGEQTKTVEVTYEKVGSSNKLWLTNANNDTGQLQGFASSGLASTSTSASEVAAKGPGGRALAFDDEGNLWTLGPTTVDAPIARFAAGDLGASGAKTPDRKIDYAPACLPGYTDMAFDPNGNLWITSACAKEVVRLTPGQLASPSGVTADVKIGGLQSPAGIAFDASGNMWIADQDKKRVVRYDASRLAASSNDPPSLAIDARAPNDAELAPSTLAFDNGGNLWATNFGGNVIYKLTPAELSATGEQQVTPSVQIAIEVTAVLEGIAFDESGGLWLTYSRGKVARLAASQLGTSSGPGAPTIPETILTSDNIGSAGALAFYPAPSALPLFAKLP
ncbi:MAG: SMP-30/gluconolactonase/LRE family protein [Labilithrix sp.]|nr:SMP-30/gluconolactonase/LRE family protein [Labilithrix sp.]